MTTTIIRSDRWNTTITFVPQTHEGKPLLRIWQGVNVSGEGIEVSLSGSTVEGRDNEVKALLTPIGDQGKPGHDNSWRQILPQVR